MLLLQGRMSQEALAVRQKLCSLAPAEGVGILAWLVETLSRNAQQPPSSQHVRTPAAPVVQDPADPAISFPW